MMHYEKYSLGEGPGLSYVYYLLAMNNNRKGIYSQ